MKKAYIILAHKNPEQLLKLITRLDDTNSTFFVHIDKQVDINRFQAVVNYSSVKLVKREITHWGGMGLVKATLNGLYNVKTDAQFERIILLSGQDYPVKENDFIDKFLQSATTKIFLEHTTLPDNTRWKDTGGLYRINKYYFGLRLHQRYVAKMMNFSGRLFPGLDRKIPKGIQYYAGSQWWIIDNYTVEYILKYVEANPMYTRFHKYTFAPDEVFFHTILLNSTDQRIKDNIINTNLMFMKWHNKLSSHPEILQKEDVVEIVASKNLFARKFEQETNSDVFDLINETLNSTVEKPI